MDIYLRDKRVGDLHKEIYYTHKKDEHVMRKFGGSFAISMELLPQLKDKGCKTVIFIYSGKKGKLKYTCPFEYFIKSPITEINPELKDDWQKHVLLKDMQVDCRL